MQVIAQAVPVAVATTDTVLTVDCNGVSNLGLEVKNTGANPLDAFTVSAKFADGGTELPFASSAGNFSTPVFPLVRAATGTPVTLAAGASSTMFFDVAGISALVFKASAGSGATTLSFFGTKS